MKILLSISFIVLTGLICLIQKTLSQKCLEYLSPLNERETRIVDCPIVKINDNNQHRIICLLYFQEKRKDILKNLIWIGFCSTTLGIYNK